MHRYVTEFVGTFFLVLVIGLTGAVDPSVAPLAVGLTLTVLVYLGGHVSGAHYNPAVSVALLLRGTFAGHDLLPYVAAQLAASLAAAGVVLVMTGGTFAPAPGAGASFPAILLAELLFTFLLVLVILMVATAPALEGNAFYGGAIGLTVAAGAYVVGPVSGAAFNPAVGIGPTVVHALAGDGSWAFLWIYVVVPMVGGAAAVGAYRAMVPAEA